MSKINKIAAAALTLAIFGFGAVSASAQTSTTTATSTLANQITALLAQVKNLQDQIAELNKKKGKLTADLKQIVLLTRSLGRGMTNEEVTSLQEILSADPDIYPEGLVTGYFGVLTEKAVKKFQKKHGIEQLGLVGPKTRNALHLFLGGLGTSTAHLPPGLAKKLNWRNATSTDNINEKKSIVCHKGQTLSIGTPAVEAHLGHGDTLGACGTSATTTLPATTTDQTAPVISNLNATSTASTTAYISWLTNEPASGTVWYSTTTPVNVLTASILMNGVLNLNHAFSLDSLTASITYYYMVKSSDAAGNTATSSEHSFITQ